MNMSENLSMSILSILYLNDFEIDMFEIFDQTSEYWRMSIMLFLYICLCLFVCPSDLLLFAVMERQTNLLIVYRWDAHKIEKCSQK